MFTGIISWQFIIFSSSIIPKSFIKNYNKIAKKIFTGFILCMNIPIKNNYYISYQGRNKDIRFAQNVLHIIKSEYDAASPYRVNFLSEKHLNKPISSRNLTNNKLHAFRQVQKSYLTSDLEYTKTLLDVFKQSRAANCKEYSELAILLQKSMVSKIAIV